MKKNLKEKEIHVVCGGFSKERSISLESGKNIHQALLELGYQATRVDPYDNPSWMLNCPFAFLALHGSYGEDGSLQALLDHLNVPYTGPGPKAASLAFNKLITKNLLIKHGIPTPRFFCPIKILKKLPETFSYPVIVKPFSEGSSIHTYVCHNDNDLHQKSILMVEHFPSFLIEEFITGQEITIGIIDIPKPTILPILEIKTSNKFYDYHAKYDPNANETQYILPATLLDKESHYCSAIAEKIYHLIDAQGILRIDMIVNKKQGPFVLETNVVPGYTQKSNIPMQAKHLGLSFNELVESIYKSGLNRRKEKQSTPK